eukprot:GSA25T00012092001.1
MHAATKAATLLQHGGWVTKHISLLYYCKDKILHRSQKGALVYSVIKTPLDRMRAHVSVASKIATAGFRNNYMKHVQMSQQMASAFPQNQRSASMSPRSELNRARSPGEMSTPSGGGPLGSAEAVSSDYMGPPFARLSPPSTLP